MLLRCKRGDTIALEVRVSAVLLARARREAELERLMQPATAAL